MMIPKPVKTKKPRKTGERELFAQVWASRPHVCESCGIAIREPRIHNFDHIETKGRRKDLRLDPSNISTPYHYCTSVFMFDLWLAVPYRDRAGWI
jgi:hypothetical protein